MHLQSFLLGAIALSGLIQGSPIPSDRSNSKRHTSGTIDCPDPQTLVPNETLPLWNQLPTRYDMAPALREKNDYKVLAAVADAIINVKPDWIPGTIFQASTQHFRNGTASESEAYKPFIHVEKDNQKKAHVPVLKLFANKNAVYLMDYTFDIIDDGSKVVWHQALQRAFFEPIVQERLKSIDPKYTDTTLTSDADKVYKAMAMMEMMTGEKPEHMPYNNFPWHKEAGEYDASSGFDPLSYSPTILYTADKKLRPITRSKDNVYYLSDCRMYGPGESGTPVDKTDELLDIERLGGQTYWGIRLPFQKPENGDYTLLRVAEQRINTDAYFSKPASS